MAFGSGITAVGAVEFCFFVGFFCWPFFATAFLPAFFLAFVGVIGPPSLPSASAPGVRRMLRTVSATSGALTAFLCGLSRRAFPGSSSFFFFFCFLAVSVGVGSLLWFLLGFSLSLAICLMVAADALFCCFFFVFGFSSFSATLGLVLWVLAVSGTSKLSAVLSTVPSPLAAPWLGGRGVLAVCFLAALLSEVVPCGSTKHRKQSQLPRRTSQFGLNTIS